MSKETLCHDFFHNPNARGEYSGCNVSFEGSRFFSYATVVGLKLWPNKRGEPVLIMADDNMTPTTCRHLIRLQRACPYPSERIVEAPFRFGERYACDAKSVQSLFESKISQTLQNSECLERQDARWKASCLLLNYAKFRGLFRCRLYKPALKLQKIVNAIVEKRSRPTDPVKAEKRRLARKKAQARLLEKLKGLSYLDKARFCFTSVTDCSNLAGSRKDCRRAILESPEFQLPNGIGASFAWLSSDGTEVITSQRIRLPAEVVRRAIRLWRAGGKAAKGSVGPYSIDVSNDQFVKVGCHYIPMANVMALEAKLNKNEQEDKK